MKRPYRSLGVRPYNKLTGNYVLSVVYIFAFAKGVNLLITFIMSVSKKNKSKGERLGWERVKEAEKVKLSEVLNPKKGKVVKLTTHQNPRLVP